MVLKNPGGHNPRLTLAVKGGDRLKRISLRVSEMAGALVADDQGMELFVKARNEPFVLQFLSPGTILRLPSWYLRPSGPNLLRPRQTARSGCYALLRKVTGGQREPTLHLNVRERGGGLLELQVPAWTMPQTEVAVLN